MVVSGEQDGHTSIEFADCELDFRRRLGHCDKQMMRRDLQERLRGSGSSFQVYKKMLVVAMKDVVRMEIHKIATDHHSKF